VLAKNPVTSHQRMEATTEQIICEIVSPLLIPLVEMVPVGVGEVAVVVAVVVVVTTLLGMLAHRGLIEIRLPIKFGFPHGPLPSHCPNGGPS